MAAVVLDTGAASRGSGNAGANKEKTVRQWFVDHDLIESVLYLPEPSGANRVERDSLQKAARRAHAEACGKQTARQGSPKGERGGAHQFYTMQNVFYLPETSRWSYIQQHAKQGDIAIKIDSALTAVEASNASLKGALPNQFTATTYKLAKMNESAKLDEIITENLAELGFSKG